MDEEYISRSSSPLSPDKVKGITQSLVQKKELSVESLKQRLQEALAPESQIDFLTGVMAQIAEDKVIRQVRESQGAESKEVRNHALSLAERLNNMAQYLASFPIEERKKVLALSDYIAGNVDSAQWKGLRRGLVGTTGMLLLAKAAIKGDIRLPTPEEDVDHGIDLVSPDTLIQIKTKQDANGLKIYSDPQQLIQDTAQSVEQMDLTQPHIASFASRLKDEANTYEHMAAYASSQGKKSAYILLPSGAIDFQSAEPTGKHDLSLLSQIT